MSSLYKIESSMLDLLKLLEDENSYAEDGELLPVIKEQFELTEDDFNNKIISYSYIQQKLEDAELAADREIKRVKAIKDKAKANRERLEEATKTAMLRFGITEISGDTRTIKLTTTQVTDVYDIAQLPESFKRTKITVEADKSALRKAMLINGEIIEGAKLVDNYHLKIK